MEDKRIKFYRGLESRYILEEAAPREGADVPFKTQFINAVYFAKDTGFIYVNGKRYGSNSGYGVEDWFDVDSEIMEIDYSSPQEDQCGMLMLKNRSGEIIKKVNLFRVYSGTPNSLSISIDDCSNYKISLNLENALLGGDNALVAKEDKMGVFLGMIQDEENELIRFGSYDASNNFREFGSIFDTKFLKKHYLKSVGVAKNDKDSSVLRFTWNDENENGEPNTVIDIPLWDICGQYVEEIKKYMINGKQLSPNLILEGRDISVGDSDAIKDCSFSKSDNIATALRKLDLRLSNIESLKDDDEDDGMVWNDYLEQK